MLVVQAEPFNASPRATTLAGVVTPSTALAAMPGNVFFPAAASGLPRDSVVNITALVTVDKDDLVDEIGQVPDYLMADVDRGPRKVLGL